MTPKRDERAFGFYVILASVLLVMSLVFASVQAEEPAERYLACKTDLEKEADAALNNKYAQVSSNYLHGGHTIPNTDDHPITKDVEKVLEEKPDAPQHPDLNLTIIFVIGAVLFLLLAYINRRRNQ